MIKFSDWLISAKESSSFTRLRWNAAMGLAPPIPDASIHSRSTATPWMVEKLTKKKKKKKWFYIRHYITIKPIFFFRYHINRLDNYIKHK